MSNLKKVQIWLKQNLLDAIIVPQTNEFLSEYISLDSERLKWISNFSGSAGLAVIMQKKAILFVDGRYTIQAKKEVNNKFFLVKHISNYKKFLKKNFINKNIIGIDPRLHSIAEIKFIKKIFDSSSTEIIFFKKNPIDLFWKNKPKKPCTIAFEHKLKYCGNSARKKISNIQSFLKKIKCKHYIITSIDSIAWLLNLRGNDIQYTPLNFSYVVFTPNKKIELFVDKKKIIKIHHRLKHIVNFHSIESIFNFIENIPKKIHIGIDRSKTPFIFEKIICESGKNYKYIEDPCDYPKAQKNKIELKGAREANIRDGVSLTKFLYWLKNKININVIDENKAAKKIFSLRKKNDLFYSLSFKTISAFNQNSALPHYNLTKESNLPIKKNGIYLIDSGAQYLDGTTDITRTIIIGNSTKGQRDKFTRVLKGHIALASSKFKKNTKGYTLDFLARKSLLVIGCDYDHGTGHGVGSFLSVHEGPQRITKSKRLSNTEIKEGMILSNEPGYYKKNNYGIRIENLIVAKKHSSTHLCFETISWAPIDINLIDISLLTFKELKWLNWYHHQVFCKLSDKLNNKEKKWLYKNTQPLIK